MNNGSPFSSTCIACAVSVRAPRPHVLSVTVRMPRGLAPHHRTCLPETFLRPSAPSLPSCKEPSAGDWGGGWPLLWGALCQGLTGIWTQTFEPNILYPNIFLLRQEEASGGVIWDATKWWIPDCLCDASPLIHGCDVYNHKTTTGSVPFLVSLSREPTGTSRNHLPNKLLAPKFLYQSVPL